MTVGLWVLTGVFMAACFVLGVVTAHRWVDREHRWQAILGVLYAVVGLAAVMDLTHVHHEVGEGLRCNQAQNEALVSIGRARREVDNAALAYDERLQTFFAVPVEQRQPDNPAVINVTAALDKLVAARKKAVEAFNDNPLSYCP